MQSSFQITPHELQQRLGLKIVGIDQFSAAFLDAEVHEFGIHSRESHGVAEHEAVVQVVLLAAAEALLPVSQASREHVGGIETG